MNHRHNHWRFISAALPASTECKISRRTASSVVEAGNATVPPLAKTGGTPVPQVKRAVATRVPQVKKTGKVPASAGGSRTAYPATYKPARQSQHALLGLLIFMMTATGAGAQTRIGVLTLNDGRQSANLSLLDPGMAAARVALEGEGFEIASITALTSLQLGNVDVLWLPLLAATNPGGAAPVYTLSERLEVIGYLESGGRVIWFGDAGIYNDGDESFLDAFGIAKLDDNFTAPGITATDVRLPQLSGPEALVQAVGASATYGLMDISSASVSATALLTDDAGPGTFAAVATIPNAAGDDGRLALVCDASIFEQFFNDADHRALLINLMRWLELPTGYTPSAASGMQVSVTGAADACPACAATTVVFNDVVATGITTIAALADGRCDIAGIDQSELPANFIGYAFSLDTSATVGAGSAFTVSIDYDEAELANLGIDTAEIVNLKLWRYDATLAGAVDITTTHDTVGQSISGQSVQTGVFLFGAQIAPPDCNQNGVADECELTDNDCNDNGVLDVCEIAPAPDTVGEYFCEQGCDVDCNQNNVPDACDPDVMFTLAVNPPAGGTINLGGMTTVPVCNDANIVATAAPGYCFDSWTVDSGPLPQPSDEPSATINAIANQTVTANFTTIITEQPQAVQVCEGNDAMLTVQVAEPLRPSVTYQWRLDGADIVGATSNQLSITNAGALDVGVYDVVVGNACDGSVTSAAATLTVTRTPMILSTPMGIDICRNQDVPLAVEVTGTPPYNVQWQRDGEDVDGLVGANVTLSDVTAEEAGDYSAVVSNACGSASALITTVTVREPPVVTNDPDDAAVCLGQPVSFEVGVTGADPVLIEWIKDGELINDAVGASYEITSVTAEDAGFYQVRATNECGVAVSAAAELVVDAPVNILVQADDAESCTGASVVLEIFANGSGVSYQWRFRAAAGGAFLDMVPDVDVVGIDSSRLTINNITFERAGDYQCIVTGTCNAGGIAADVVTLTVGSVAEIANEPEDMTACPGQDAIFRVAVVDTSLTYDYQWVFNGQAISIGNASYGGVTTNELTVFDVTPALAGNYSCRVLATCPPHVFTQTAGLIVSTGACDCNDNGVDDLTDTDVGTSDDCNANGRPDECEIDEDSTAAGGPFYCTSGCNPDCNNNGIPDGCDIDVGAADDCNADGVPDSCQLANNDCDADGLLDSCQLFDGDCNQNGILDRCEVPFVADAGDDLTLCLGRTSPALGGPVVASGSTPGYTYLWQVIDGPMGAGSFLNPTAERAQFSAIQTGLYTIELRVTDAVGCVATDEMQITVYDMTVDAGEDQVVCADDAVITLSGTVTGGVAPIEYTWSIEPGSPDVDPSQFTGGGAQVLTPTFEPSQPGEYTLRLTVTDANVVNCLLSDTVIVRAIRMDVAISPDVVMCLGSESSSLSIAVTSSGTPPFAYEWSIDSGSPDTNLTQFTGAGRFSPVPTFTPNQPGAYTLRARVTDSSEPPCEVSKSLSLIARTLSVDVGGDLTTCVSGVDLPLTADVAGGTPPLTYQWRIEPGSTNTDNNQFVVQTGLSPDWAFRPQATGAYTLRLTVTDSANPPCVASDALVVRADALNVDAGSDRVVQAFGTSDQLGALPLVVGASGALAYEWRVIAGPSSDENQFSDKTASRPTFTPASVGEYALEVRVTSGDQCGGSDIVILSAIADALSTVINGDGRAFMTLQLDGADARADVRFALTELGRNVSAQLSNTTPTAGWLSRQLTVTAAPSASGMVLTVALYMSPTEWEALDTSLIVVLRRDSAEGDWEEAADREMENGFYPARPTLNDVGRQGIDSQRRMVWAIVDRIGEFAVGDPDVVPVDPEAPSVTPEDEGMEPVPSGMCGMGAGMSLLALPLLYRRRRRHQP